MRRITNVAAGIAPTDAVNVSQLTTSVLQLSTQISSVQKEERRGIAATAATAFVATPTAPGRTTFAVNGAFFENQGGGGVAFAHRFAGTSIPVYISGAYGNGGGKEHSDAPASPWNGNRTRALLSRRRSAGDRISP